MSRTASVGATSKAKMLTTSEVAERLGRTKSTVKRWCLAEGLPHQFVGGRWLVAEEDLAEWRERPEIQDMLQFGERIKTWVRGKTA